MKSNDTARLWKAIRGLQRFTNDELQTITGCKPAVFRSYIGLLLRSGYLKVIDKAEGSNQKKLYKLAKDTGPKPLRKRTRFYDPNTGEAFTKQVDTVSTGSKPLRQKTFLYDPNTGKLIITKPKGPSACG